MMTRARIKIPQANVAAFCQRHHIRKLALFGSVLHDDFRPGSDIDVLVEFEPGHVPGLIRLAGMELELSEPLGGRKVDMNTPMCLSPYVRDEVLAESEVVYVRAFSKPIECQPFGEFDRR
jgi:predicted nucleotidyltransferase